MFGTVLLHYPSLDNHLQSYRLVVCRLQLLKSPYTLNVRFLKVAILAECAPTLVDRAAAMFAEVCDDHKGCRFFSGGDFSSGGDAI